MARQGATDPRKTADALNLAKQLSSEHPKDVATNQLYASLLLDSGARQDVQKSLQELKSLVQNNNADPVLHYDLARAYYSQGDLDKATTEALEAIRIRGSLMPARVLAASLYEERGQHGKALEQTAIVLDKQPRDREARLVRGRALIGLKELDKAQQELEALVRDNPAFPDGIYQLANLYLARKDYGKAQEEFEKLGPGQQHDLRGFVGIQNVKLRQGHWQEAVRSMEDLVQKNPDQPSLRATLANFQAEAALQLPQGDERRNALLAQAENNDKQLLNSPLKSEELLLRLGTLERMLGKNQEALSSFEAASKLSPGNAEAVLNRGMVLESLGERDKARDAYNQALGLDPDNVIALNNLAFLNAETNQNLDQAMTYAERAKKRLPGNANVADTLGYIYYRKGLTQDAIRELQSAVESEPKNASYHLHLAMALLQRGDKSAAKREAENALRTANKSDQQERIRSFMSQIG